ncbi:PIG-L family deacetylase [Flammeovirga pacifica]|uniref:LmbE family protein n=1 Tax=Flammeovirga pacifica TaxID=915059 RepID=A0A1S1YWI9_FLAPC|nr:PIG-L family deacetylase [Flammeovirga pacifica]OHX65380.1 hypothetical protein NH26_02965 [Flammeovirga pacifica]
MRLTATLFLILLNAICFGQTPKTSQQENVSNILQEINHLNTLGAVMYFAAHPDDENQRVIAFFARAKGYETAYTSLTRGDGGQNLIGTEIREELGILRSQELIEARKVDGGQQMFSRANDFGYSKNPQETLSVWDKDQVLADAVWNIRRFRPDIIITRFSPNRGGRTHGHHTTSAIIALEAYKIAGDSTKYPEQLKYVSPWQPKRIMWNTNSWFFRGKGESFDASQFVSLETGDYIPVLGKNVGEIAMAARSKHRCQGFGAALQRGENKEYFELLDGAQMSTSPMEGVDTSWKRVDNASKVESLIKELQDNFTPSNPSASINQLIKIKKELQLLDQNDYWVIKKSKKIDQLILQCSGIFFEALVTDAQVAQGDSLKIELRTINRSKQDIKLTHVKVGQLKEEALSTDLTYNKNIKTNIKVSIPSDYPVSQPYWLAQKASKGMYRVDNQKMIGQPENNYAIPVEAELLIGGIKIKQTLNIWQKKINPALGEVYIPLGIVPPATIDIDQNTLIFGDQATKKVKVSFTAKTDQVKGKVNYNLPKGWKIETKASLEVDLEKRGDKTEIEFIVTPSKKEGDEIFNIYLTTDKEQKIDKGLNIIDYEHISRQYYFVDANIKLIRLNIDRGNVQSVAYVMGAGDVVPQALITAGYQVNILDHDHITKDHLKNYDAVVIGIRAYNVLENMRYLQPILMDYVYDGGSVIVQYNTSHRLKTKQIGPYKELKLSRDRITVEESKVEILAKKHPLMVYPNKINQNDFDGWVQERGLYFPNEWGEEYTPILRMQDPNEDPVDGALLVADYGQGAFIYSGISWFRELPAGVSGAYRIFANMLNYKPHPKKGK